MNGGVFARMPSMNARSRALLEELRSLPVDEREAVVAELYADAELLADDLLDPDGQDRAGLHASLVDSIEQMKRGETIDGEQALAEIRAHR